MSASGERPQLNKFEQVSSLDHQISLAEGSSGEQIWTGLWSWPSVDTNWVAGESGPLYRGVGSEGGGGVGPV